jgi:transposase-like protein
MGRKTSAKRLVESLEGEASTKAQLQAVLDVLAEKKSVAEACAELGVGEATFHRLRERVLAAALEALLPKRAGRPPKAPEAPTEVEELKRALHDTRVELEASRIREEIALVMPHLLKGREVKKKSRPSGSVQEIFARRRGTERT